MLERTIEKALRASGKILIDSFGKIKKVNTKQDQSNVVTQADLDSEKAIVEIIQKAFPDHNIIAEETGFRNKNSAYTWIVDPLDGSSNFASKIPWFGIIISVLKNFKPVMAGVYLPCENLMYFAEKNKGAFRNGKKISITKEQDLKNVLFSYCLDYSKDFTKTEQEANIIKHLVQGVRNLRATNSVVDFCYTADGRLGGCINQTTKIWDIAAPYLLIREAGGIVTDIDGKDIDFTVTEKDYQKNFTIVGSNKVLYKRIMDIVNKARK